MIIKRIIKLEKTVIDSIKRALPSLIYWKKYSEEDEGDVFNRMYKIDMSEHMKYGEDGIEVDDLYIEEVREMVIKEKLFTGRLNIETDEILSFNNEGVMFIIDDISISYDNEEIINKFEVNRILSYSEWIIKKLVE